VARQSILQHTEREALNQVLNTHDLWASSGEMTGYKVVHKFGHNLDVNGSYETLWSAGGTYSYLGSATVLKISSADANDDDGDTGARTVLVQGLDTNYNEIEETVTLNGQTAVNTSNEYLRVYRMTVQTAGSSNHNEGIVYAGTGTVTSGVPANIYAEIPAQYNQTMMAVYTIPADKTGYITTFYASPDSQASFQTQLTCGNSDGIMRVRNQLHAFQTQAMFNYRPYLKIEEKTDVELRCAVGTANTEFGGGFSIILVDNN